MKLTDSARVMVATTAISLITALTVGVLAGPAAAKAPGQLASPPSAAGPWSSLEAEADENGTVPVVAMLKTRGVDLSTQAQRKSGLTRVRDAVIKDFDGKEPRALRALPGAPFVALHADSSDLETLKRSANVQEVFADRTFDSAGTTSHGGANGVQLKEWWHQTQLGMPWLAANGWNGRGQTIAIIDTGVDKSHSWLAGRVINEACFSTNANGTGGCSNGATYQYSSAAGGVAGSAAPCTHYAYGCSHGTHVAHIAAGTYGAAPGARIIAIRASHPEWDAKLGVYVPKFSWSDLANALWYVYDPLPYTPAAVNLSIGGGAYAGYCDTTGDAAVRNLAAWFTTLKRDFGITTVVSSGNDNYSQYVGAPACASNAVSVGNSTLDPSGYDAVLGNVTGGSNSNSTVDLLAPGTDICSAVPVAFDVYDGVKNGIACDWFGTSMAAPQVAGAIAILRQGRPTATSDQMVAALQRRGVAVTDSRNNITKTRINIANAVYYF